MLPQHAVISPYRAVPSRPDVCIHYETFNEICDIFVSLGFQIVESNDVELDYYNFEALNIPAENPRAMICPRSGSIMRTERGERPMLLRTHTTAATAHCVATMKPPFRVIEPGKVYRYEATDATHLTMFHQVDGVAVDKGITMADLKGVFYDFLPPFLRRRTPGTFPPRLFPVRRTGVEVAVECAICHGSGCRLAATAVD